MTSSRTAKRSPALPGTKVAILLVAAGVALACEREIELALPPPETDSAEHAPADPADRAETERSERPMDDVVAECDESIVIESSSASPDEKLAAVRRLAADGGPQATRCLVAASSNPSVLVSMASIRALTGRSCEDVTDALTLLLDDEEWQRRAWSAKVLGDNRCNAGADALMARLGAEPDARVRDQIQAALADLQREVAL